MAQFRAIIQGQRGEASRLGSKSSGIRAEVHGWDSGVDVTGDYEAADNARDEFLVYANSGNANGRNSYYLGRVLRLPGTGRLVFAPGDDLADILGIEHGLKAVLSD